MFCASFGHITSEYFPSMATTRVHPSEASINLNVLLISGESLGTWSSGSLCSLWEPLPFVAEPGTVVQGLLTNSTPLDAGKTIGAQVKTGNTLTAILGRNPTLAPVVQNHLDAMRRSDVSSRYHALEALADLGPSAEGAVP